MEPTVLREVAESGAIRLSYRLWLRDASTLGLVMTFIYQGGPVVLKPISVRCIRADGHEHHRMVATQPEVHPALKARALSAAHF